MTWTVQLPWLHCGQTAAETNAAHLVDQEESLHHDDGDGLIAQRIIAHLGEKS